MSDQKAYQLRADVADDFAGGSVAIGAEGHTLALHEALDSSDYGPKGFIVTADPIVQAALESDGIQQVFKSVAVPQNKPAPKPAASDKE